MREKIIFFNLLILIVFFSCNFQNEKKKATKVITSEKIKYYVDRFNKNDNEIYKQFIPNNGALKFLSQNLEFLLKKEINFFLQKISFILVQVYRY